ncbi:MAG: hypothetical protein ABR548_00560 [Actinomycetota bacterium]|nr:hypothetical protein [Actinomycetota bacterium]
MATARAASLMAAALLAAAGHSAHATGVPAVLTAAAYTYAPGDTDTPGLELHVFQGSQLVFVNADPLGAHAVTSEDTDTRGYPLFNADAINMGLAADVSGVSALAPGRYPFYCYVHAPSMTGVLVVDPLPV